MAQNMPLETRTQDQSLKKVSRATGRRGAVSTTLRAPAAQRRHLPFNGTWRGGP